MKTPEENSDSPTLSFSGAAALLLLVAAFCAYPCGASLPAIIFAGLAFVSLSFSAPTPARVHVRRDEFPLPLRHDGER
jgi:hypothetical protein